MAPVARHDTYQLLFAAARIVVGSRSRRPLSQPLRQVRKEAANLRERVLLALGLVVDRTTHVRMDIRAAEFLLGQLLADAPFDHRRSRDKHLTTSANHHRTIAP